MAYFGTVGEKTQALWQTHRFYPDLKFKEIGLTLGLGVSTTKKIYYTGRQNITEYIKNRLEKEDAPILSFLKQVR